MFLPYTLNLTIIVLHELLEPRYVAGKLGLTSVVASKGPNLMFLFFVVVFWGGWGWSWGTPQKNCLTMSQMHFPGIYQQICSVTLYLAT